jgi:hypothetical protein
MKNLLATLQLPDIIAKESAGIIDAIFNHSTRMKEMENQYKLAKKQLDYAYDIEVKRVQNDLEMFQMKISAYIQNINNHHTERMAILQNAHDLTLKIASLENREVAKTLSKTVSDYLKLYENNSQQNIGFLNNSNRALLS